MTTNEEIMDFLLHLEKKIKRIEHDVSSISNIEHYVRQIRNS